MNKDTQEKTRKKILLTSEQWSYVIVGIIICSFYLIVKNLGLIYSEAKNAYAVISPIVGGVAIAYLLNLLMDPLEKHVFAGIRKAGARRLVSMLITVLIVLIIVAGLIYMLVPQLVTSVSTLYLNIESYMNTAYDHVYDLAMRFNIDEETIQSVIGSWNKLFTTFTAWLRNAIPMIVNYSKQLGSSFVKAIISFFVAMYILADRDNIIRRVKYTLKALIPDARFKQLAYYVKKSDAAFGGFIKGKLIDSLIIAIITLAFTTIFKIPYRVLISTIIGITNIVPTIGPLIGTIPCVFILLLISPLKAFTFLIFILILQQIDGNYIGPRILSNAVGISPLWILIAVFVCGDIWGIKGMIIGVPLFSVLLDFARELICRRLDKKGIPVEEYGPHPDTPSTTEKEKPGNDE